VTHRFSASLLAVLLVLTLAACANTATETADAGLPSETAEASAAPSSEEATASEEPAGEEAQVRIENSEFDTGELTVAVGTEVTWVNADTFEHTITEGTDGDVVEDPIVDEEIDQNGTVSVTFDEPGSYDITCQIHPSMQMTVIVGG
jgi:plastocyanin